MKAEQVVDRPWFRRCFPFPRCAVVPERTNLLAWEAADVELVGVLPDVLGPFGWWVWDRWRDAEMLLDGTGSGLEVPVLDAHEQIHAGTAAALVILAAALVAVPRTSTVLVVEAVAIGATAKRAGLVAIGELISGEATKVLQQVRPPAVGEVLDAGHAWSRSMAVAIKERIRAARDMSCPALESSHWSCSTGTSRDMVFLRCFGMVVI